MLERCVSNGPRGYEGLRGEQKLWYFNSLIQAPALVFEGTLALTAVTDNLLSGLAGQ